MANNYPILRYRIDAVEKCSLSPRPFNGFRQGLRGFQRTKFRRNYVGHKRIVPGRESALGTNSLIQIHERPSVYPPLEGSAIKTDSSMDDGGIRPAVNQTTKFLVSARAACWEVLSIDGAVLLSQSSLSVAHPLVRSHDAQGCNYASEPIAKGPLEDALGVLARRRCLRPHPRRRPLPLEGFPSARLHSDR